MEVGIRPPVPRALFTRNDHPGAASAQRAAPGARACFTPASRRVIHSGANAAPSRCTRSAARFRSGARATTHPTLAKRCPPRPKSARGPKRPPRSRSRAADLSGPKAPSGDELGGAGRRSLSQRASSRRHRGEPYKPAAPVGRFALAPVRPRHRPRSTPSGPLASIHPISILAACVGFLATTPRSASRTPPSSTNRNTSRS